MLAVMVARVPGASVAGEIETEGGLDESRLKLPAAVIAPSITAQT